MTAIRRHRILTGLVLVNLAGLVSAVVLAYWPDEIFSAFCLGSLNAGYLLLPIWSVLGTNRWPIRAAGVVLGSAVLLAVALGCDLRVYQSYGFAFDRVAIYRAWQHVAAEVYSALAAATVLHVRGARLVLLPSPIATRGSAWPRFSIKQLMLLTAVVGIVITVIAKVHADPPEWPRGAVIFAGLGAVLMTWVALGATLSAAPAAGRVVLTNILAVAFALVTAHALYFEPSNGWLFVKSTLSEGIWLTGSLLVVRACGYRLLWPDDWQWTSGILASPTTADPTD